MRHLTRFGLAAATAAFLATGATAQITGTTGTTTATTGTTTGGAGGGTSQIGSDTLMSNQTAFTTLSGSAVSGSTPGGSSNALGSYYANPLYAGRPGAEQGASPGGFGSASYGSTGGTGGTANRASSGGTGTRGATTNGTTTNTLGGSNTLGGTNTGRTGTTGNTAGRTGMTGAAGRTGTTGAGGFGNTGRGQNGANVASQGGGEIIAQGRQISYTLTPRFPVAPVMAPQVQADIRGVFGRSSMITNPGGIDVSMQGTVVVLRGVVRSQEEAETAAGMARLTPGVRQVKNELQYPKP